MSKPTYNKIPPEEIKLTEFYIAFRLNKWFITDNKNVLLVPKKGFCSNCFKRRYFSEYNAEKVSKISSNALNLAIKIDMASKASQSWSSYSIAQQKIITRFELISYENCPLCNKSVAYNKADAERIYENLLNTETAPKMEKLKKLLFSFGFAKATYTSDKLGFPDERVNKILGGNFYSRVSAKMLTFTDFMTDLNTLGYSNNKALAETKASMEFIERYAFAEHTSPLQTEEIDTGLINNFLSLYSRQPANNEINNIKSGAVWAANLATGNIHPIPIRFIYDKGDLDFIRPCSSGFAAHTSFKNSLVGSIFELVERDAFVRFWYDPLQAYNFSPNKKEKDELDEILSVLKSILNNENLVSNCFVVRSTTMLPVVMTTLSSSDFNKPPSLLFGYGAGFSLQEALLKSLNELRTNICNMLAGFFSEKDFMSRSFNHKIKSIPERMNFYSTKAPRPSLDFLNMTNPLNDSVFKDTDSGSLDEIVTRFTMHNLEIFGIDATPKCFKDTNVFVTRAFSPNLYPLQYDEERSFNLSTSSLSAKDNLPHFFI